MIKMQNLFKVIDLGNTVAELKVKAKERAELLAIIAAARLGFVPKQALDASLEVNKTLADRLAKQAMANAKASAALNANGNDSSDKDALYTSTISDADFKRLTPQQQAQARALGLYK